MTREELLTHSSYLELEAEVIELKQDIHREVMRRFQVEEEADATIKKLTKDNEWLNSRLEHMQERIDRLTVPLLSLNIGKRTILIEADKETPC